MQGREFGGDAFVMAPPVVVFKDFEPGQTYTAKCSICNRSYAKNTYRVVEVGGGVCIHSGMLLCMPG